eukprot:6232759-Lingulodinium_polyedra.AAC.1
MRSAPAASPKPSTAAVCQVPCAAASAAAHCRSQARVSSRGGSGVSTCSGETRAAWPTPAWAG